MHFDACIWQQPSKFMVDGLGTHILYVNVRDTLQRRSAHSCFVFLIQYRLSEKNLLIGLGFWPFGPVS